MTANIKSRPLATKLTEVTNYEDAQNRLPYWARSTNPIVRRHLGLYWRTVPPEIQPFITIFLVWLVVFVLGMIVPPVFGFTMISFIASILIIPFAAILYGYLLLGIAIETANIMQQEFANDTFELLQATPMSLSQIFLGKVSASLWKRMDDLIMVGQLTLAFSPPILFDIYTDIWSLQTNFYAAPLVTLIASLVVLARCVLEPMMIGILSVYVGIVVEGRSRAVSSSVVLGAFYFILLNLLSRLPMVRGFTAATGVIVPPNGLLVIITDLVLPIALPIIISLGLLKLAERTITENS